MEFFQRQFLFGIIITFAPLPPVLNPGGGGKSDIHPIIYYLQTEEVSGNITV